ncbi:MAG: hypothetical protein AB7K68_07230 [Bacteriovoracia bacterium]
MKKTESSQEKNITGNGAPPKPPCDPDCSFEDIFVSPIRVSPPEVDSTYIHEGASFFSRLFGRRPHTEPKKVA